MTNTLQVYKLVVLGSTCLLAACGGAPSSPVTPAKVIEHVNRWNGEIVTVDGWLGRCQGLDCQIYSNASDMRTVARMQTNKAEWSDAFERGVAIGFNANFDSKAAALQFNYVRLKARVNNKCSFPWSLCYDRADTLVPMGISAAVAPEKAH